MTVHTTRRRLCGGSAALMAIAGAMPALASMNEPNRDAPLIAAAAEYVALEARIFDLTGVDDFLLPPDAKAAWEAEELAAFRRQDALRNFAIITPAHGPDGIRAKATLVRAWITRNLGAHETPLDSDQALAWSMVADVLGVPAKGGAA
jgi:hypothetical protein